MLTTVTFIDSRANLVAEAVIDASEAMSFANMQTRIVDDLLRDREMTITLALREEIDNLIEAAELDEGEFIVLSEDLTQRLCAHMAEFSHEEIYEFFEGYLEEDNLSLAKIQCAQPILQKVDEYIRAR